jgi:hypothetical protein
MNTNNEERVLGRLLSQEQIAAVAGAGDGTSAEDDTIVCTPAKDNAEEGEEKLF